MNEIIRGKSFTAEKSWAAKTIANMNGITTRLHWTEKAYQWHVNDGQEVFVVLDGEVTMHYEKAEVKTSALLTPGDIFYGAKGTKHSAVPKGEARILVIEKQGSI
ncbi:MAG: cupin domain-containing protein [Paraglaciecola sp.]|uniref:cupin domain-containing protein n=1 Tax=Paraglaciecola sp. TaxID=1920173 RepID=UPI003263E9D3